MLDGPTRALRCQPSIAFLLRRGGCAGSAAAACRPGAPAAFDEVADPGSGDGNALCREKRALEPEVSAEPAEPAGSRHHAVAGDVGGAARPHDVADRPMRAGSSRGGGDVTVGGDPARRDSPHDGQHARRERRRPGRVLPTLRYWQVKRPVHQAPAAGPASTRFAFRRAGSHDVIVSAWGDSRARQCRHRTLRSRPGTSAGRCRPPGRRAGEPRRTGRARRTSAPGP